MSKTGKAKGKIAIKPMKHNASKVTIKAFRELDMVLVLEELSQ